MASQFPESNDLLDQMARGADSTVELVDSLVLVGQGYLTWEQRLLVLQRFQRQTTKLGSWLKKIEAKIDGGLDEPLTRLDGGLDGGLDERLDEGLDEGLMRADEEFVRIDGYLRNMAKVCQKLQVREENCSAMRKNQRLDRMDGSIHPIKVGIPDARDPTIQEWQSHPKVPLRLMDVWELGQHAKGKFELAWATKSHDKKVAEQDRALRTIQELTKFYGIKPRADELSDEDLLPDSEGFSDSEVEIELDVGGFMEDLLGKWGVSWRQVQYLGVKFVKAQQPVAGVKRRGGDGNEEGREGKKRQEDD